MQWNGSPEGLSLALRLSQLRSAVRVGQALAARFPTEASWEEFTASQDFQETMTAVAEVLQDIDLDVDAMPVDALAEAVTRHHGRALEAVEPLADELVVPTEDIVSVLSG